MYTHLIDSLSSVKIISLSSHEDILSMDASHIIEALSIIKNNYGFNLLLDIIAVDYFEKKTPRFSVNYYVLNMEKRKRLRITVNTEETVPSIVTVYKAANWYEREAYDLMGIIFLDHPKLERLLTDDNFDHFPLRKDFPVEGFYEVTYDSRKQQVIRRDVSISVPTKDFSSSWKGSHEH